MTIELHPLCTLFPRMLDQEFMTLTADIKENGLRQPITLLDGMILDGGNRYRACLQAGVEPVFVNFSGGNIVSFVLSANLHRRHMTAGQQAAIVASAQDWAKAQTASRPVSGQDCPLTTVADRAAQSGAHPNTQKMADKVAKANPELAKQVAHGEKTLPQAIEELTGKRPGAKPALAAAPNEPEYNPAEDDIAELSETVKTLAEENDTLKDRLACEVMPASEEEKTAALETITFLRAEVKRLEIENKALIDSRNSYQRECAELKRQCAMQRRQLEKVSRVV